MTTEYETRTKMPEKLGRCTSCCFGLLSVLAEILMAGAVALVLFWVLKYRDGFGWHDDPKREFNLHPVLMVVGFSFLMGNAILIYRVCRCCRGIYRKLLHTLLHLFAMPVVAIGIVAVFDYHKLDRVNSRSGPLPDLYSMHSWMGLITLGLFGLQFIIGFFSFLVLLCCDSKTANYRAALAPIHAHFGLATFIMSIGTALTGLTEKALQELDGNQDNGPIATRRFRQNNEPYYNLPPEAYVVNALAMVLIALGLVVTFIVRYSRFQAHTEAVTERL